MNEKTQSEFDLQVVDLGDAKELTLGFQDVIYGEDNPDVPGRRVP